MATALCGSGTNFGTSPGSGTSRGGTLQEWLVAALVLVFSWPIAAKAEPFLARRDPTRGDTSRAARQDAVQGIPLERLSQDSRAKVEGVLADTTIFRRLPVQVIQCDPDMYLFLVEHPDVVVNIWEVFGITQLAVRQIGRDTFRIADEDGTTGTMELLYASHDTHVLYADGSSEGPVRSRPIRGRVLVVLKSGYVRETDGKCYVTCRLDAFLQVDRAGVEFVTKTLQPVVGHVADVNFAQTAGFLGSLSRTAETNPDGVVRLASKLTEVQPPVRQRLAELAEKIGGQAASAEVAEQPAELSVR